MVSKLELQTYMSEFESYWVLHSYGLVPYLKKSLVNYHYLLSSLVLSKDLIKGRKKSKVMLQMK